MNIKSCDKCGAKFNADTIEYCSICKNGLAPAREVYRTDIHNKLREKYAKEVETENSRQILLQAS